MTGRWVCLIMLAAEPAAIAAVHAIVKVNLNY